MLPRPPYSPLFLFFFNDTATTEIYTLSLHDALPIYGPRPEHARPRAAGPRGRPGAAPARLPRRALARRGHRPRGQRDDPQRSEEHTSELQSRQYLVCRLLLEKKTVMPIHHLMS